jgi:hypothetical protein
MMQWPSQGYVNKPRFIRYTLDVGTMTELPNHEVLRVLPPLSNVVCLYYVLGIVVRGLYMLTHTTYVIVSTKISIMQMRKLK